MIKAMNRSELKMVARSFGWKGKASITPVDLWSWFESRNISREQVFTAFANLRNAISGRSNLAPVSTGGGLTREEVNRMIVEAQLNAGQADQVKLAASNTMSGDMKAVRKLVQELVAQSEPRKIIVTEKGVKVTVLKDRTHPMFEKVLALVLAGLNVLLVGPAGCGKSRLAHDIARALKRKFGTLHCTAGASESMLTGWLLPVERGGNFTYVPSEFVTLYTEGNSVFLLDEIDAADPNMLLVINAALANGSLHIPQNHKHPHLERGKNASIIAAANTFGHGADTIYAGRNQLDAATLDRFYVVAMDYDTAYESELCGHEDIIGNIWTKAEDPTEDEIKSIGSWIAGLRQRVKDAGLKRVISTRMFQKAIAARNAGVPTDQIKSDLMAGWKRDELMKVGITV